MTTTIVNDWYNYIVNIAVRRDDGKVECDTIYAKNIIDQEQAQEIAEKFGCSVIVSNIGLVKPFPDKKISQLTFAVNPAVKETESGETNTDSGETTDDTQEESK